MNNAAFRGITLNRPARVAGRPFATGEARPLSDTKADPDQARRFREMALPHLDEVYTLARHLLRDASDADDAVQDCYLRALKHFASYRGPAIRPWLFAILRNVCNAEYLRRTTAPMPAADDRDLAAEATQPLWQEPAETPEARLLKQRDAASMRGLIAALDQPFREVIVLREIHNLPYRDIAAIIEAPVGTVMSRLARARTILRAAWIAEQEASR